MKTDRFFALRSFCLFFIKKPDPHLFENQVFLFLFVAFFLNQFFQALINLLFAAGSIGSV